MKQLLLTINIIFGFGLFAQNEFPPIINYSTHDYDESKIRNPENFSIVQDKEGIMYFGNSNGVMSYDGENWRFIDVTNGTFVRSMAVDSSGTVYVGTYGDFGYLEADISGKKVFKSLMLELPIEDQFFSDIWYVYATKTRVFFMAQEAFFEYEIASKKLWTIYPEVSFHTAYLVDTTLYLREREKGIVKYENDEMFFLDGTEILSDYGVFGIYPLKDDSLLIITQELGMLKWKNNGIAPAPDSISSVLNGLGIFGSYRLSDGNIALNTFANGVVIINTKGEVINVLDRSNGLRSNDVKSLFEDQHNNLWIALGNGIAKANYFSPLSYMNDKNGFEGNVQAIIRFKERLFVGTSYGLFREASQVNSGRQFENTQMVNNQVWDFEIVNGQLFIASSAGIFKTSDGVTFVTLTSENANVILFDKDDNVFVHAGSSGIHVRDINFRSIWSYENNYTTFLGIEKDPLFPSTIWLGTSNSGVFRVKLNGNNVILDQYGLAEGLNDDELGVPLILNQKLVFGSSQGLLKFITEDEMVQDLPDSLKNDPEYYRGMFQGELFYDSLIAGQILFIKENADRTWYGIEHEVGYYDKVKKTFVSTPYKSIDYGRMNQLYLEENGTLWAGFADGLIRFKQESRKRYDLAFSALIRSVSINTDSTIFYGHSNLNDPNELIEIPYKLGNLQFSYSATYYEDDHKNLYAHKLEGHDEDWTNWSYKNEANYTNLSEGEYVFYIKAKNIYGQESLEDSFSFTILPPWYRTSLAYIAYVIVFLLILYVGVRISSARLKSKNIWLEGVVATRTKEIQEKNEVLEEQKKEIQDSINYAQRIQHAILPLELEMKKWIPNSYVLFRPKDIVSGDFYWFMEKEDKLIFVCADCTGHGVPGAFMSMIGSDRLNNIVSERRITSPGLILSELNRAIKKSLKQDGHKDSTRDGMDAAICTINLKSRELSYAGANRPLWIAENNEMIEVKATKVAVAGFTSDDQIYEEHHFELRKGQKFYMSTDGYADQFGGEFEKKYKVKNMKDFILQNVDKDFGVQRDLLEKEIKQWMGNLEQIDDICVVGFEPIPE